ncbi:NADPH-dependent oxidoreductase [Veillonella criceti]|uniref:FMN reductase (NADPH) n=1 Tax=Veillonella criceti TaxID=103891 RepID=A0A380NFW1_9FIRM|nr:NADPH-dependent oxidoreductase [Veillonella criceti]SUP40053.1 FMN reductase (NADPH) [Veillonella criceti]
MNPIDVLLNHRTIREFKSSPIPPQQLSILLDVAKRTASSQGMQSFSIIRIVDPAIKAQIAEVCNQEYVARVPELFIFLVDAYRNSRIAREQGVVSDSERDSDRFFQGWTDASLAAQNMVAAAEMGGFGTVYFGSILNNVPKMIEILKLPELTFPMLGLGIGVPNQKPQLKPRMPREANVFDDAYTVFDSYKELLEDYDEEMEQYYDMRDTNRRVDSFTKQIASKKPVLMRQHLIQQAEAQGFKFTDVKN